MEQVARARNAGCIAANSGLAVAVVINSGCILVRQMLNGSWSAGQDLPVSVQHAAQWSWKKKGEPSNVVQLCTKCGGPVDKHHLDGENQRPKTRSGFSRRRTETVVSHAGTAAGTVGGSLKVPRRRR
jgi:hypothetical protein